ncbi:transporter substrate-binding domain-containing protein [Desulfovibrio sp. OttesenSCG-928-C06]|nr:transporter substrate-binding domain-containing protein [Desulfovibrio sp. OttesenSCG-928-C06]
MLNKKPIVTATVKVVCVFALLFGLTAFARPASAESALENVVDAGVIRVGVYDDLPPMSYLDGRGRRQGYEIDIARRVATDLLGGQARIELVLLAPQDRLTALDDGAADVLFCNLAVTPEHAEAVDFAAPYLTIHTAIASSLHDPIMNISQLRGKKLIVVSGTTAEKYFAQNHPEIALQAYPDNKQAFEALILGFGAGMAHDSHILLVWTADNPQFSVSMPELGEPLHIAPAVKNGDSGMREWLDSEISALASEGFLLKTYAQHMPPSPGAALTTE